MKHVIALFVAAVLAAAASVASADFHLFRFDQIYSNADGSVQFVVLRNIQSSNNEHRWKGRRLSSRPSSGATKFFTFPNDLPSSNTADRSVLVATQGFAALGIITPDFVIPNGFLPFPAGTLNFADAALLTYSALPTDGVNALDSTRTVVPNVATNFSGASASVTPAAPPASAVASAVEFYNQGFDHYFVTHVANEIALLDAGTTIKGWTRTGQAFKVWTAGSASSSPVCRFYIPPANGDSHFYGRGTIECNETAAKFPTFVNEDPNFFNVMRPNVGVCPAGTRAVYRVFSNRVDANHRYMVDPAVRDQMIGRGWLAEGEGPDLVVMCAPV